jgi:nicotinate-nucleotide pyrophosphorylase (carboxylating)
MTVFDLPSVDTLVRLALEEDIGRGDLTTQLTVPASVSAQARIVAKEAAVVAGLPLLRKVFGRVGGGKIDVRLEIEEGTHCSTAATVASLSGAAADLLSGERVALNFLQHLSGIATLTRRYVDAVAGTRARIVDTRKTLPGFRLLEKYAVRIGGGHNHRLGLDDGVLIKDNHIVAAGGIAVAIERARSGAPHTLTIEVECASVADVEKALGAGAEIILLDNMSVEDLRAAVRRINNRALVEASGGITLETVRAVAETGVDMISVGALTHSVRAVDLSMEMSLIS